jgi:hypothetical protein
MNNVVGRVWTAARQLDHAAVESLLGRDFTIHTLYKMLLQLLNKVRCHAWDM